MFYHLSTLKISLIIFYAILYVFTNNIVRRIFEKYFIIITVVLLIPNII